MPVTRTGDDDGTLQAAELNNVYSTALTVMDISKQEPFVPILHVFGLDDQPSPLHSQTITFVTPWMEQGSLADNLFDTANAMECRLQLSLKEKVTILVSAAEAIAIFHARDLLALGALDFSSVYLDNKKRASVMFNHVFYCSYDVLGAMWPRLCLPKLAQELSKEVACELAQGKAPSPELCITCDFAALGCMVIELITEQRLHVHFNCCSKVGSFNTEHTTKHAQSNDV